MKYTKENLLNSFVTFVSACSRSLGVVVKKNYPSINAFEKIFENVSCLASST